MGSKTWQFQLEDGTHAVAIEHSPLSGKRTIHLDGVVVEQSTKLFDTGSEHPFMVGGHRCVVQVKTNGITFKYDLVNDGYSMEAGRQVASGAQMPSWAWAFMAVCAAIPLVTLGGALPAAIGVGGVFGCRAAAIDSSMASGTRVAICVGITAMCWMLTFLVLVGLALIRF
jgi:hypothetical protein